MKGEYGKQKYFNIQQSKITNNNIERTFSKTTCIGTVNVLPFTFKMWLYKAFSLSKLSTPLRTYLLNVKSILKPNRINNQVYLIKKTTYKF